MIGRQVFGSDSNLGHAEHIYKQRMVILDMLPSLETYIYSAANVRWIVVRQAFGSMRVLIPRAAAMCKHLHCHSPH